MRVIAIGTRMPSWVTEGSDEYLKRMPRELPVEWVELPASKRTRDTAELRMLDEASAIERRLKPQELMVALDINGKSVSTERIADALSSWQVEGAKVVFIIGGPDGLHPTLKTRAVARWSLGRITLPHPLVRVILAEQLYRAWSINAGHPYHRA
jgi:23S rRNA (pseudouridine1915-N3)-methyltransferase